MNEMNLEAIKEKSRVTCKALQDFLKSRHNPQEPLNMEDVVAEIQALLDMAALSTVSLVAVSTQSEEEFKEKMESVMASQPVDLAETLHHFALKHIELSREFDSIDESNPV